MSLTLWLIGALFVCWLLVGTKREMKQRGGRKSADKHSRKQNPNGNVGHKMFYEPSPVEQAMLEREAELRKQATAYKRQKNYDKAVEMMRAARKQQYQTSTWYDIRTLLRIPDYLILAGRYQEAINEANDLLNGKWKYREQQDAGFAKTAKSWIHETIAEAAEKMGDSSIAEKSRKAADSSIAKIALARRSQVEKDCRKQLKEVGHDLVQIADCCDSLPSDSCRAWHGRIISAFGRVPGFPTLADLDVETIFGGELGHRLDYVDETIDVREIERQKR